MQAKTQIQENYSAAQIEALRQIEQLKALILNHGSLVGEGKASAQHVNFIQECTARIHDVVAFIQD